MGMMLESEIQRGQSVSLVLTEEIKTDRLESIVGDLMGELGLDLTDQHFAGTPARVAGLYRELTRGSRVDPAEILKTFDSKHSELIVVSEINFYSLCPHHLLIYRFYHKLLRRVQASKRIHTFFQPACHCRPLVLFHHFQKEVTGRKCIDIIAYGLGHSYTGGI